MHIISLQLYFVFSKKKDIIQNLYLNISLTFLNTSVFKLTFVM